MTTKASDRKLLELAAKAAGADWAVEEEGRFEILSEIGGFSGYWNPLTDDGDALRLAVKLNLLIDVDGNSTEAGGFGTHGFHTEPHGTDPYAATRRAIVRAAAASPKEPDMYTTTNTRGVYYAAHVKAVARALQTDDAAHYAADAAHMLEDYAAALSAPEPAAQGEDGVPTVDLDAMAWETIKQAARASKWIPPEYYMGDWIEDVRDFLVNGHPPAQPADRVPGVFSALAKNLVNVIDDECERVTSDRVWEAKERLQSLLAATPAAPAEWVEFCSVCHKPFGPTETRVGTGDGTMRANNGRGSFAHRHCYDTTPGAAR